VESSPEKSTGEDMAKDTLERDETREAQLTGEVEEASTQVEAPSFNASGTESEREVPTVEESAPPDARRDETEEPSPLDQGQGTAAAAEAADDASGKGGTDEQIERLEDQYALAEVQPGDVVKGTVVMLSEDHALVDVGYKSEGYLPVDELSYRPIGRPSDVLKVGDEIEVMVLRNDGEEGVLRLSKRRADERHAYEALEAKKEAGEIIEAPVVEAVKGGLVVDVGTRGFIPASQVERGFVEDLAPYVGQTLRLKIIEVDGRKRRVILSRRKVLDEERQVAKQEIWNQISEGEIRPGRVKSLTDFGAFIDLGGVDGLLHVSELSWGRVQHPSQVLQEGQEIQVKVLRLDRERGRISLGLKQVLQNPWEDIDKTYPEGSIVIGKVVRLATFGAFVELAPGIDGLIHVSQLSDEHVTRPSEVVQVGDEVRVKVLRVDPDQRRVSLSLREGGSVHAQAEENRPQTEEPATIADMVDDDVKKDLLGE